MAVLEITSYQMLSAADYRQYPIDNHGKMRMDYFNLQPVTVAGDIGSTFPLCLLPPGRVRILPWMSRVSSSAWGASRTLAIGNKIYASRPMPDYTTEADNPSAFASAIDVSAAMNGVAWSTVLKYDVYSEAGVTIYATVAGGTIPVGATLTGFVCYLYE